MDIVALFCEIHDFFLRYEKYHSKHCLPTQKKTETRGRKRSLHPTEVMTILIAFPDSNYRTLKHYYLKQICVHWTEEFPNLVSYARFVQPQQEVLPLLEVYLQVIRGTCSGISIVDSTKLAVCDINRTASYRVFAQRATLGKSSMGWFYGFKLHLVINDTGNILAFEVTSGNTDDRKPVLGLCKHLFGSLYADRGYISKDLREQLRERGINLVYRVRKNMDPLELSASDEEVLKKRQRIETVIGVLKEQLQLEHSRHRSVSNFCVNIVSTLIAYQKLEKKPCL